jgi:hypothetical protein
MSSGYTDVDGNWQWPQKTWFRERLNALKAQEDEHRRKPLVTAKTPTRANAPDATNEEAVEAD